MKKLLLISLIIGTALSQTEHERNRIARLRRRQQLENLSERDFSNGGFLPSGSSRVSDGFRGSENSFDTLSGRRRRFQSNVVMQNVDSPVSRPRNYLQSLRSTFRRNGGRTGRLRGSFWNTNRRPVDEQTVRRTYRPAIKRPRFTPNIRDILPRRRPSYSPTARGIDSVWTPRLPSTVTEAGNFHPSNINDFIERTNPVNDRSYISPKKPSLIVEPIPLPPLIDPGHISAKEQNPSQTHKPDYVAPVDSVLPVKEKSDYVTPVDPVLPVKEKSDYVAPVDPVLPINHKPDYVAPADLDASLMPNLPEPEMLPLPSLPKIPFDVIDPLTIPPVSVKNPNYVPKSADPSGSVTVKDQNYVVDAALKDPLGPLDSSSPLDIHAPGYVDPGLSDPLGPIPNVKDANYVADKALKDPLGPFDSSSLPLDINAPGYVDPVLSDPLGPLPNVKDANYVADKALTDPLGPLDSSSLPLDINAPGYVDPVLPDPLGPLPNIKDANYVADKALKDPLGPLDSSNLPLDINAPGYVDPVLSDPLGPLPNIKDANYVADKALKDPFGPLDSSSLPLDINAPGYVDPVLSDPLGPLPNVKDANYVADKALKDPLGPLDSSNLPLDINTPGYVDPSLSDPLGPLPNVKNANYVADKALTDPLGPLDSSSLPLDINAPGYVDPGLSDPLGPKTNVKDANYVADKALKDLLGPLDSSSLPLDMNDPGYVDPALSDPLPNVNDPNYVADPLTFDPSSTLDIPTLPVKETNNIGLEQLGPLDRIAPSDISGMPVPEFPNFPVDVNDPNYVEPPATGLVGPLDQLPFGPSGAAGLGLDPLPIDQMNPLRPLTPLGTWDSSAILPSTKPGYVPPNESPVGSMGPIGDVLSDPHIPDTLPISTDALLEPLLPTGGLMGEHLLPLESSKNRNPDYDPTADPQALVINNQANVLENSVDIPGAQVDGMPIPPKNKVPKGSIPDVFGPLDLPQDAISSQDPFSQFPTDNMSPLDGGLLFPSDIPSLPGLFDPLSTDFGSNGGPIDLFPDPSNFAPEPPLPHSPIFDENLPPNLDTNAFPLDPPMPTQVMTRSEINEAARREYAKSADAFDPKWNNPNVRNSDLYVKAKPVDPNAARPANVKTLFDFTAGTASADFINKAVDKVSEKTKDIMTARSRKREGYLTKYDALRSYEG